MGRDFVCGRCKLVDDGLVEPVEECVKRWKQREVSVFWGIGCAGGGCEAAVTEKARIGWVKFKESEQLLNSKWFSLKIIERNGLSELCEIGENEIAILRTERAMATAMCGIKPMEKERTEDLIEMFGLKETVVQMAKANGVR